MTSDSASEVEPWSKRRVPELCGLRTRNVGKLYVYFSPRWDDKEWERIRVNVWRCSVNTSAFCRFLNAPFEKKGNFFQQTLWEGSSKGKDKKTGKGYPFENERVGAGGQSRTIELTAAIEFGRAHVCNQQLACESSQGRSSVP